MKCAVVTLVLLTSFWGSGQAKSFGERSDHRSWSNLAPDDYSYTYGDLAFNYDGYFNSGYYNDLEPEEIERVEEESEMEATKHVKRKSAGVGGDKIPHVVIDDFGNYDYTYGDPDVDYYYVIRPGDEARKTAEEPISGESPDDDDIYDYETDDDESATTTPRSDSDVRQKNVPSIVASAIEWILRNWQEVKGLRNQWIETKDHVKASWKRIKNSMKRIRDALGTVLVKFGSEAEAGLRYCIGRLETKGSEISEESVKVIEKLEKLLEEGNQFVRSFFKLIGHKVEEIKTQYGGLVPGFDVKTGSPVKLTRLSSYPADGGDVVVDDGANQNGSQVEVPNLFEDEEVLHNLKAMVDRGILDKEEVEALLTAASEQTQRATGRDYPRRVVLL